MVGTGYVGLVSGTCFAETGIDVTCVDVDKRKIDNLNNGILPIWEPGLDDMVSRNVAKNKLRFTTSLKDSLDGVDVVFSAVGTPPDDDGSADLKFVIEVAREVGRHMNDYLVMVTKSTVPIGTAERVRKTIQKELDARGSKLTFDVASNPEFLKEGSAIQDFLKPDRIVVGVDTEKAQKVMSKLYRPFLLNNHPVLMMDIPSAEMTKYAANSMLATKISFMNDIANLCEIVGADVKNVRLGIGSDTRIGNKFIYPGAGYGGSCFPKDVKALIKTADENGYSLDILKSVEAVNDRQKSVMYNKVARYFNHQLKGKKIALWGLSFKPNTDDMREAPSLVFIEKIMAEGGSVKAYDPVAMKETEHKLGDKIEYASDMYDALIDADALVVITEWSEFRMPNMKIMEKLLKNKLIFDGRNIYDPIELKEAGWYYEPIGKKGN
jgi:UDPglucose 6-dehydrogenase